MSSGTHYRGEHMTRIETFVAAAFAFAVTMLVISVDSIPGTFAEFFQAVKGIPAFAASFASITWIWFEHAQWCKRYGLEDGKSVLLSCVLVLLVLVYIYPLKLMMQALFGALSGGYLPFPNDFFEMVWEVRFLFAFYAIGFFLLCVLFFELLRHARNLKDTLNLSREELEEINTDMLVWLGTAAVCLFSFLLAITVPNKSIGFAGYALFLIFPVTFIVRYKRSVSHSADD